MTASPTPAAAANAPRGLAKIDEFLTAEHRSLDGILADVEFLAARRSFSSAARRFGELRRGLERHIEEESTVLLPIFRERTGDPTGLVPMLEAEHQGMRGMLDQLSSDLTQGDAAGFGTHVGALDEALRKHHEHEERLLHPELEKLIQTESDWHALAAARRGRSAVPT